MIFDEQAATASATCANLNEKRFPGATSKQVWANIKMIDAYHLARLGSGANPDQSTCTALQECCDVLLKDVFENGKEFAYARDAACFDDQPSDSELDLRPLLDVVAAALRVSTPTYLEPQVLEIATYLKWLPDVMAPRTIIWVHRKWLWKLLHPRITYAEGYWLMGSSNYQPPAFIHLPIPETDPLLVILEGRKILKNVFSRPPIEVSRQDLILDVQSQGTQVENVSEKDLRSTVARIAHRTARPVVVSWSNRTAETDCSEVTPAVLSEGTKSQESGELSSQSSDTGKRASKRRGRRPNTERRDAIRNAITKQGEGWRDHLGEIVQELDRQNVPLQYFLNIKIELGEGAPAPVVRWSDLDLAEGDQRKRLIDALRKYG